VRRYEVVDVGQTLPVIWGDRMDTTLWESSWAGIVRAIDNVRSKLDRCTESIAIRRQLLELEGYRQSNDVPVRNFGFLIRIRNSNKHR